MQNKTHILMYVNKNIKYQLLLTIFKVVGPSNERKTYLQQLKANEQQEEMMELYIKLMKLGEMV